MKLETNTLLQNCFSRIITITSTQQNFTSVKKKQLDIITRLVQKALLKLIVLIITFIPFFFKGMQLINNNGSEANVKHHTV